MTCLPDQYGDDPGTYREAMRARAEWQADLDERRREREHGEQHTLTTELQGTYSTSRTVSVTVFLGRDNTWAEAITRALTEGPDDGPAEIRSNLAFYPTRALTEGEGE